MSQPFDFHIRLDGETRRFTLDKRNIPSWTALNHLIKQRFHLPLSTKLRFTVQDGKMTFSVDREDEYTYLRDTLVFPANRFGSPEHRLISVVVDEVGKAPLGHNGRVWILLGNMKKYRAICFPADSPPSLSTVLALTPSNDSLASSTNPLALSMVDKDGDTVEIASEGGWREIGWKTAVNKWEEGKKKGTQGWEAAKFDVEVVRCVPYASSSSPTPLIPLSYSPLLVSTNFDDEAVSTTGSTGQLFSSTSSTLSMTVGIRALKERA
jgi:hypothetical protein